MLEQAGVNSQETIQGQVDEHLSGYVTFQQQAEIWLKESQTRNRNPISEATASGYRSYLQHHLDPVLGELPLSAVDNNAMKGLVKKLHDKKLAPKTIVEIVKVPKLVVASLKQTGRKSTSGHGTTITWICRLWTPRTKIPRHGQPSK